MIITLDSKRRITLPTALISAQPGDTFDARFDSDEGALVFRLVPGKPDWMDVLAACPIPMDDVPPRRKGFAKKSRL